AGGRSPCWVAIPSHDGTSPRATLPRRSGGFTSRSLYEGDRADAEVWLGRRSGGADDARPHDACEPARQGPGGAVGVSAGDVERRPGDDVVLRLRPLSCERVVD